MDPFALIFVGVIVWAVYQALQSQEQTPRPTLPLAIPHKESVADTERRSEPDLDTWDPMSAVPEDARPLLAGLLVAMRSPSELGSFTTGATPSALEEVRAAMDAVSVYAAESSPDTAAGLLETRLYEVVTTSHTAFEARVFIGTPFTNGSGRTVSVIRQDVVLLFRLVAPTDCEQCGAPVLGQGNCEYCGARTGLPRWRLVGMQPANAGLAQKRTTFVGYRMPDPATAVSSVS